MTVAIVHDYLTQRGGAERVVLSMLKAFPDATIYTSLYDPGGTFSAFRTATVRTPPLDRVGLLRQHHRLALPVLARTFSNLVVDADVVLCSSSGWAHGVHAAAERKVVYCHSPAKWLYEPGRYLAGASPIARVTVAALRPSLVRWDAHAAHRARRYLTNSTAMKTRIRGTYGIEAEILPPAPTLDPAGPASAVPGLEPGFFLCVARLISYKNVDAVIGAFASLPGERLVVVGSGPLERVLRRAAGGNVTLLGAVSDEELRWLYRESIATVAASYEDFGLTPLEAAGFGRPSAVLRWGGFLDTVVEGLDRPVLRPAGA